MRFILCIVLLIPIVVSSQVKLDSTNLGILLINTNGRVIQDEPKIIADMTIIWDKKKDYNKVSDNTKNYQGKIAIELRGSTSQGLSDKKPYAIELKTSIGLDTSASLMDMPKESDWALLAPFTDKTLIREALTYQLAGSIMPYAPRFKFCELVLNGEYQGIYMLTEKIKRDKNRVDISKLDTSANEGINVSGGYILKLDKPTGDIPWQSSLGFTSKYYNNLDSIQFPSKSEYLFHYPKPEDISAKQRNYIITLINEMQDSLASKRAAVNYPKFFDINSLLDFLIINELTRNVDGYRLSSYLYKDRDDIDPKIKLGPVWDFNIALGNANYCEGNLTSGWAYDFNSVCGGDNWTIPFWWKPIINDVVFKDMLRNRWTNLRKNILSNNHVIGLIDSMSSTLTIAADRNFKRWSILNQYVWPNPQIFGNYPSEVNYLKLWLSKRMEWVDQQLLIKAKTINSEIEPYAIYPNPCKHEFVIKAKDKTGNEIIFLEIINELGISLFQSNLEIMTGKSPIIPVNLSPGIYFCRIHSRSNKSNTSVLKLEIVTKN